MNALQIHNARQRIGWLHDAADERRLDVRTTRLRLVCDHLIRDRVGPLCDVLEDVEREMEDRQWHLRRAADRLEKRLKRMADTKPHEMWALRLGGVLQGMLAAYKDNYEATYTTREASERAGTRFEQALSAAEAVLEQYAKG